MTGCGEPKNDDRPLLLRRAPSWSVEQQRGEPERPGFNAWDDRVRSRQNIIAAVLVAVLGVVTYLVFDELRASSRRLACIEAGHRNCGNPIIPGNGHR
jgi:hypothetical protein